MAVVETVIPTFVAAGCLLLAWAIDRGGAVGLIAGYQKGEYLEEHETELARDVRNLLLVVVALCILLVVNTWTEIVPQAGAVFTVVTFALVGWLVWKWNWKV